MIERSKLDQWYDKKTPLYDLSSSGLSPDKDYKNILTKQLLNVDMFDYLKKYGATTGDEMLVSLLCQKYNCTPTNILITNGASEALYIALQAFANQKCDILYQCPYYQNLDSLIAEGGNYALKYNLNSTNNFNFVFDDFEKKITSNTRLVILNFPNNPTGSILEDSDYKRIIDLSLSNDFKIIFDEVSSDINYHKRTNYIENNIAKLFNHVVCINSMSKVYGFAGLRVGWIVADEQFIYQCQIIKEIISVSSAPFSQLIATELLKEHKYILTKNTTQVKENLKYLLAKADAFRKIFSVITPQGGACCLIKVLTDIDVDRLCMDLYNSKGVLVTPGSVFGYDNYIRIGLGEENKKFRIAIELFIDFILNYKK